MFIKFSFVLWGTPRDVYAKQIADQSWQCLVHEGPVATIFLFRGDPRFFTNISEEQYNEILTNLQTALCL